MSLPATDPDTRPAPRPPRGPLAALGWVLACGLCSGGGWAAGLAVGADLLGVEFIPARVQRAALEVSLFLAGVGAISGFLTGILTGDTLRGPRRRSRMRRLGLLGMLAGTTGGGLTLPTALACGHWLHPLASSALLWAIVGAFVALLGFGLAQEDGGTSNQHARERRVLTSLLWACAGAATAGGAWAVAALALRHVFGVSFVIDIGPISPANLTILHAIIGAGYGLFGGAVLGFARGKGHRFATALALGIGGAVFGTLGGGLSVFAAAGGSPRLDPVASSSLVWAAVGFVAALCASLWPHPTAGQTELFEESEDAEQPVRPKVERTLIERRRRRDRAWLRVLPVPLVSAWALLGATVFAPSDLSVALLAVGVLGLAVTLVLYGQECRIRELERR